MMCDKCVKKSVCKLCDGGNIQGCIEFYKPHEEILEDMLRQMKSIKEAENQIYKEASWDFSGKCMEIVSKCIDHYKHLYD